MKSSQIRWTLRPITIGICLALIIDNRSDAFRLPLVNQLSISWGSNGVNLTSSEGASNVTITKDDSVAEMVDADQISSDKLTGQPKQSEEEKSRISWFPGGLHKLNDQIMSEMAEADSNADTAGADPKPNEGEKFGDGEKWVESVLDDQAADNNEIEDEDDDEDEGSIRSLVGSGDLDDDGSGDDEATTPGRDEKDDGVPRNGQRGGALVKQAKPQRSQILAPLETDKVASAASRLLNDDSDEAVKGQSNEVYIPTTHAQELIDGLDKVELVFNIDLNQGTEAQVILNLNSSESESILALKMKSNSTVNTSLETQAAPRSVFRGIRKRTAKRTRMHGFFSHKYSKSSHDLELNSRATNNTIQQEDDFKKAKAILDEAIELTNTPVLEYNKDPMNNQGTGTLHEAALSASKRNEHIQINATASDLELIKEVNEKSAEDERSTQHEIDGVLVENLGQFKVELGHTQRSLYESSGAWGPIDAVLTLGLASKYPSLKASHYLRGIRKLTAHYTGLHGLLSGKNHTIDVLPVPESDNEQLGMVRRRLAAIERARRKIPEGSLGIFGRRNLQSNSDFQRKKSANESMLQQRKLERVKEIDRLYADYQLRMLDLVCEKDMLQRRPNPLWNYTSEEEVTIDKSMGNTSSAIRMIASRRFSFPPQDLVDNYLEMLFLTERLVKLNHTDLWRDGDDDDEDDDLSEDFLSAGRQRKRSSGGRTSGNWLLRNGLGQKIGEAVEMAAYKSICKALMSILARSVSSIHGLNVMKYSDIRLSMEPTPGLPPLLAGMIPSIDPSVDYAKSALRGVMFRGAKKNKRKRRHHRRKSDFDFLQRGAIVETLLSHAQISAPLLQHFPLAWQRELLSNIITMATTIISDFTEGLEFHILGHRLSFSFTPITEEDMLRGIASDGFNRRRPDPEQYEAAIRATAVDLSNELKFLDKWHERALGSDMLRSQIANLIARLVIHLIDDLLRGARLDLWASHGGPRLVAGLEFRSTGDEMKEQQAR